MAIRKIVREPDPILRKVMPDIEDLDKARQVVRDLIDTMHASAAAGFAANQINEPWNICIVHERYMPDGKTGVLINPKIIEKSKETYLSGEGCFSIPGYIASVPRFQTVTVAHLDMNGKPQTTTFKWPNWGASSAQHEIEHLRGILIRDYVEGTHKKSGGKLIKEFDPYMQSAIYKDKE